MQLLGKEIELQQYGCSEFGSTPRPIRPFVNLYVKVTNGCNAHCRFCCNAGCQSKGSFNLNKLKACIEEINHSGIRLNRICLTGGEPSVQVAHTGEIINYIADERECLHTQLQLNTNGLSLEALKLMSHPRIDVVSVSLHHYDRIKLQEIFGCRLPEEIGWYPMVKSANLNVSCNLIRGYIDSANEVEKYLKFVASKGISTVGFVGLMQMNDYCHEHFIDFSEIDWPAIPHLYKVRERGHANHCKCCNYVFDGPKGMVNVYMRKTINPDYCASSLLFDGKYLRQGFNNDNIIY